MAYSSAEAAGVMGGGGKVSDWVGLGWRGPMIRVASVYQHVMVQLQHG